MRVSVKSRALSMDDQVREEIRSRIYFALSRFSPHMEEVKAEFEELVIQNRKSQQLCRLSIQTKQLGNFVLESVDDEMITVVSEAAVRAAKKIQRLLEHERDKSQWAKL